MTADFDSRTEPVPPNEDGTDRSPLGDGRIADLPRDQSPLPDDSAFALCLTHDVDRPYKGLRSLYYAMRERPGYHLRTALSSSNPYWQFDEIMALEEALNVRSAFYVLNEQHLLADRSVREWLSPANWVQHLGRYDITAPDIVDVVRELDAGGWEVGLHGSYHSADDPNRLREEKTALEDVLGRSVTGGRQHYLRLSVPETWEYHRAIGLAYDASLGSSTDCGFHAGYRPVRPFDDDFLVFPLTIMEQALPDPGTDFEAARETCERLLTEAAENDAVMTVLWHPRYFNEREFPGYRALYRWLIERALELGAWVGSPRDLRAELEGDASGESRVSSVGP
ncbi:polysaccharide deacetylase family protein [Natrinema salinisoli]|uniref:polysaccharide deacetylase family protein n=1 Tax=Natrinema salinisoli TaxID=2878535 RepID=UPI001CF0113B|nr:polysaccharide deacetylase family protein [Natrinema salinisoli]